MFWAGPGRHYRYCEYNSLHGRACTYTSTSGLFSAFSYIIHYHWWTWATSEQCCSFWQNTGPSLCTSTRMKQSFKVHKVYHTIRSVLLHTRQPGVNAWQRTLSNSVSIPFLQFYLVKAVLGERPSSAAALWLSLFLHCMSLGSTPEEIALPDEVFTRKII